MRPHSRDGQNVGHLPVEGLLPHSNVDFDKIEPHDKSVLPHLHDYDYALKMFPTIEAAEPQPNLDDWAPGDTEGFEMFDEVARSQKPMKKRGVLRVAPSEVLSEL